MTQKATLVHCHADAVVTCGTPRQIQRLSSKRRSAGMGCPASHLELSPTELPDPGRIVAGFAAELHPGLQPLPSSKGREGLLEVVRRFSC